MWPSSMQFQSPCRNQINRWCNSVFICCQGGCIKLLIYVWSHLLAPIFRINWICRRDARSRVYWLPSVGGLLPPCHWHVYSPPIVWSLLKDVQLPRHRFLGWLIWDLATHIHIPVKIQTSWVNTFLTRWRWVCVADVYALTVYSIMKLC